jgi:hypothetical protein
MISSASRRRGDRRWALHVGGARRAAHRVRADSRPPGLARRRGLSSRAARHLDGGSVRLAAAPASAAQHPAPIASCSPPPALGMPIFAATAAPRSAVLGRRDANVVLGNLLPDDIDDAARGAAVRARRIHPGGRRRGSTTDACSPHSLDGCRRGLAIVTTAVLGPSRRSPEPRA